ncbi:ribosomal-processing cysteine protease Prp [Spiroplasma gladiatoris]|uniref:Ribosomal processing cysteine protease Prp n=1 Tax=Spiroplasma gladiatoris TaxID=2143 RepID=A0A4P7AH30_9MOLU|nr:ribosomal-processing cysteine protease Prp [Spiroplasma gladiatoris]QBQ07472.1 ribosomal-processing cysteine protease Prp [Spiroplasma gladiatoris]
MIVAKFDIKEDLIKEVKVYGHSNSNEYGKDLVCAGVTAIMSGTLNGLDQIYKNNVNLIVEENEIKIIVLKNTNDLQKILRFLLIQLETISIQYPNNFKIEGVL